MAATLDLGIIGNCTVSALIDRDGVLVWSCFPRFDGDPVFYHLVDNTPAQPVAADAEGVFSVRLVNQTRTEQSYRSNTAILTTRLYDDRGGVAEVLDFAPRFFMQGRMFRPPMIIRQIYPLKGRPRLRVRLRPKYDYGRITPRMTWGSHHVRYVSPMQTLRLTTNMPVSYLIEEQSFVLEHSVILILGPDESLPSGIESTARDLYERTAEHWQDWVRSLSIPFEWQDAVIRAAITLKLCHFEETGAIVAAHTTSIPEAPNSGRNWDYRYCWLRDAYLVIQVLNRLGVTRTMETYLAYIANVVDDASEDGLQPVYGITGRSDLQETEVPALAGYRGMGPVRIGNQAFRQIQNDVYGSVILAATHVFFDRRLLFQGSRSLFEQLENLGDKALSVFDKPDAGPWELRSQSKVHTFSSVMCWAACDRLAKIADHIGLPTRGLTWRRHADRLHKTICERAWNPALNSFASTFDGADLDATLLLLHEFDFLKKDDPRFAATVDAVGKTLRRGDSLLRYSTEDDFGVPECGFVVCAFWYIDALASLGRRDEARALFEVMLSHRNGLGLLSEDIAPDTGVLWGNFPQTYSLVGMINSAMRLSQSWEVSF